ncbi:MAG: hypothetical protein ACTHVY_09765 [Brevibacterium yomogidense]|uniref:Uncharacterized protein n=1 Tax=Brevibacterium yomogidense TaxID=946573 RepID=A0A1X6X4H7_9MICO|nr:MULTISPECIES: hypothetical protein [Brevibacterium]SLM93748.1 hypothetical protein FM105_03790 [Brevibacterium yomogidense]SMX92383.1 hypothetical protein BSP109_02628 [Brevibacterium sp. Mu109]
MPGELIPPLGASDFWIAAAVFGVLLAVLVGFLPLIGRLRGHATGPRSVPVHVRSRYAALIDAIEERYASGDLTTRTTAQELSALLRDFASEAWGASAKHMTQREMREAGIAPLADAVSRLYTAEFERDVPETAAEELRVAREVITRW